jgi:hypothetical protein
MEGDLEGEFRGALAIIGRQLNGHIYPRVQNGGIVVPGDATAPTLILGQEKKHAFEPTARRPAARSWPRSAGGARASDRSWTTCTTAPLVGSADVPP